MMTDRVVPHDDPRLLRGYGDLLEFIPAEAVIIEDEDGRFWFQGNRLIKWMMYERMVNLNRMSNAFAAGFFSLEEYMEFYRGLGYSLDGFGEIFAGLLRKKE